MSVKVSKFTLELELPDGKRVSFVPKGEVWFEGIEDEDFHDDDEVFSVRALFPPTRRGSRLSLLFKPAEDGAIYMVVGPTDD